MVQRKAYSQVASRDRQPLRLQTGLGNKERSGRAQAQRARNKEDTHIQGWKQIIAAPKNKPDWMPDKINKPFVKKVGIEKLDKL